MTTKAPAGLSHLFTALPRSRQRVCSQCIAHLTKAPNGSGNPIKHCLLREIKSSLMISGIHQGSFARGMVQHKSVTFVVTVPGSCHHLCCPFWSSRPSVQSCLRQKTFLLQTLMRVVSKFSWILTKIRKEAVQCQEWHLISLALWRARAFCNTD
jgi:hypothetical protein